MGGAGDGAMCEARGAGIPLALYAPLRRQIIEHATPGVLPGSGVCECGQRARRRRIQCARMRRPRHMGEGAVAHAVLRGQPGLLFCALC